MTSFQLVGALLTVIAVFGYINHRFIKLPDALGITAVGMVASFGLLAFGHFEPGFTVAAKRFVLSLDFPEMVFHGFLGLLLFAGAMHVDTSSLREHRASVLLLATAGVVLSTALVGLMLNMVLGWLAIPLGLLWCLAFGALISPTDPVAVLSVLKRVGMPASLESKFAGEALFNDGVSVVLFMTLVGLASGTAANMSIAGVLSMLAREVVGAIAVGIVLGLLVTWMLRHVDSNPVELFLTLALATAGYAAAEVLHVSAALAVVVMGLIVGHNENTGVTAKAKEHLANFWGIVDELLNLVLFGLIGLQVLTLTFKLEYIAVGFATIGIVLIARYVSVGVPLGVLRSAPNQGAIRAKILTWGGLRGGVSIALALSLPDFFGRDLIQVITYMVVAFSLLVQAPTLASVVRRLLANQETVA